VKAAREAQQQREREQETQQNEELEREVERQLAEIRKKDPAIKTIADFATRPYWEDFKAYVDKGNTFLDAFYLANREKAEAAAAEAARQSAVNNLSSKKHLKQTSIGGKAGAVVTAEERKMFRLFNPDATDDQIQKYQNKYVKG